MADFSVQLSKSGDTITPDESITFGITVKEDGSPVSGKSVTFSVSPDDGIASVSPTSATTDSNGQAQTTLSLSGDSSESKYTVWATVDGVGGAIGLKVKVVTESDGAELTLDIEQPPAVEGFPPVPPRPRTRYSTNQSVGFVFSLLKDGSGVSGKTVTFSVSPNDGTASVSPTSTTTDSNGSALTILTLGSNASGRYKVTATLDDGKAKSKSISVYNPPVFSDGSSTTRNIAENTPSGTDIGNPVTATDIDGDTLTLTYSLSGTDAASFSIDSSTGQLRTAAALDYETKKVYNLTITATHASGAKTSIDVTINVTDVNEAGTPPPVQADSQLRSVRQNNPPVFSNGASTTRSVAENTPSGTDIGSPISATDPDGGTLTYSLSGTDAAAFSIDSSTGQLRTAAALDYETKKVYNLTITVTDASGAKTNIDVIINVTDVNETVTPPPVQPKLQTDPQPQSNPQPQLQSNPQIQQSQPDPQPELDPQPEPNYTIIPFDYEKEGVGKVVFSELMLAHLNNKYPQWIELYNTTDQDIDIKGWKIVGRYLDDSNTIKILESQVISKSLTIKGKETVLIVSYAIPNSRDRISSGLADQADALGLSSKNFWNYEGLVLELQDAEGNPIDRIGNLSDQNEIVWEIPSIVRNERVSLNRRLKPIRSQEYNFTLGIKKFGWFPANQVERLAKGRSQSYYGSSTDIGSPGYRTKGGEILPVALSSFNPQINQDGAVVISWITESEVDNAGFNILRSNAKKGPFVKVNPKLIQGAGTTGERNAYRWVDTTAKPNIEYYYQIEDVSLAGIKQTLVTRRLKGIHTAKNRALTSWGIIKQYP